tara:strand:- start:8 stop:208 length:201 start_codon:yes stop_codon:yes gene_type:complete
MNRQPKTKEPIMEQVWHIRRARDNRLLTQTRDGIMTLLSLFNHHYGRPRGEWVIYFGQCEQGRISV